MHIVIKALVDHRANHHLGTGVQLLNGMPHQMSKGVTNNLNPSWVLSGDNGQLRILTNHITSIYQLAIDLTGQGRFSQTSANALGDLHDRHCLLKLPLTSIRQGNNGHGYKAPFTAMIDDPLTYC